MDRQHFDRREHVSTGNHCAVIESLTQAVNNQSVKSRHIHQLRCLSDMPPCLHLRLITCYWGLHECFPFCASVTLTSIIYLNHSHALICSFWPLPLNLDIKFTLSSHGYQDAQLTPSHLHLPPDTTSAGRQLQILFMV
jgi:hypothetical protein